MRIAFVTPTFVTESNCGIGTYLLRIAKFLRKAGHEIEIFVSSVEQPGVIDFHGIKIYRVKVEPTALWYKVLRKGATFINLNLTLRYIVQSRRLCRALERIHNEDPFQAVQYTDFQAVGLFMSRKPTRLNIVRASTAIKLYNEVSGRCRFHNRIQEWLELISIRRADTSYAPSHFVANHYKDNFGIDMKVIRPPLDEDFIESEPSTFGLPAKYFIHFGQLCHRKGTHWLIDSLNVACKVDPSIRVVMIGQNTGNTLENDLSNFPNFGNNIILLHPLPQNELYRVLKGARAAIIPSIVDNLPNAAVESLLHGVPIIGSKGASIDEIVEEGVTGELAEMYNIEALSNIIVRFWQEKTSVKPGFTWSGFPKGAKSTTELLELIKEA